MTKRAYILGSGFSRAVGPHMPMLSQLSTSVVSDLAARGVDVPGGTHLSHDFEQWMSYLADVPPWLSNADAYRNRAGHEEVAASVWRVLSVAQIKTLSEPAPEWLLQLVRYWHAMDDTVITFNYDLLVEMAWLTHGQDRVWLSLYPAPVTPAALRTGSIYGGPSIGAGLHLLKLHGSLNWYWSGADAPSSDPVYDLGVLGPWNPGDATRGTSAYDAGLVFDKSPMIVPPAAVKSPYYRNDVIRGSWRRAAKVLRDAEEVVLMGFSLPPTDSLIASLLATELSATAVVVPVNPDPGVSDRLNGLLGESDRSVDVTFCSGDDPDPIQRWVEMCANS